MKRLNNKGFAPLLILGYMVYILPFAQWAIDKMSDSDNACSYQQDVNTVQHYKAKIKHYVVNHSGDYFNGNRWVKLPQLPR